VKTGLRLAREVSGMARDKHQMDNNAEGGQRVGRVRNDSNDGLRAWSKERSLAC